MNAIILAGGRGTRLKRVVRDAPKVLAPVRGLPFLDILLRQLEESRCVDKVILAVGYKKDRIIRKYRNAGYGFVLRFSRERRLLGTGGAVKMALRLATSPDVMVLNGDSFTEISIPDLIAFHRKKHSRFTVALTSVNDAGRYGKVEIDRNKRIKAFHEKMENTGPGLVNAGVYVLARRLFDRVAENKVLSLEKDIIPSLAGLPLYGYSTGGKFIDIGIPADYRKAGGYLAGVRFGGLRRNEKRR